MTAPYPSLFSPLNLHGVTLRNRVVHASMTTKMGVEQRLGGRMLNYHRSRAIGGAGMIVTEPLAIQPWHNEPYKVDVRSNRSANDLARWAEAVESQDCRLLGQLQDSGRGRHESGKHPYAVGPSALPDDLSWVVPRALTADEIEQLVERFVIASKRLRDAGFSGVEISAAHGHLFHQFLSPWSNQRDDDWGGSVTNRARIVCDLAARIRDRCGADFVIGIKLPGEDGIANSIDRDEACRLTAALADPATVSYFCHAQGSHSARLDMHLPDMHGPRAPFLDLLRAVKPSAGPVPVMALGLITDPAEAERTVVSGDADLIGLGRPLVTDAAWPEKARLGRAADIRYCVSCNTCWATIIRDGREIACDNNPRVGEKDEADWWPQQVSRKKRVVVVGGGVAGLEAGWVAAARGHDVTLLNSNQQLGGSTWLQAQLPGGENLSSVYDYQLQAAGRANLKISVIGRATVGDIEALEPDHVVLATGAEMLWPRQLSTELCDEGFVLDLREVMRQLLQFDAHQGGTVLLYDQDHTLGTYMAAEKLRSLFDRVVIATPREAVAQHEALVTRQGIHRRLNKSDIDVIPFMEFGDTSSLEDGIANVRNIYTGEETEIPDIALLTYATPRKPNDALLAGLRARGISVQPVGDCLIAGSLREATQSGYQAGNVI